MLSTPGATPTRWLPPVRVLGLVQAMKLFQMPCDHQHVHELIVALELRTAVPSKIYDWAQHYIPPRRNLLQRVTTVPVLRLAERFKQHL